MRGCLVCAGGVSCVLGCGWTWACCGCAVSAHYFFFRSFIIIYFIPQFNVDRYLACVRVPPPPPGGRVPAMCDYEHPTWSTVPSKKI